MSSSRGTGTNSSPCGTAESGWRRRGAATFSAGRLRCPLPATAPRGKWTRVILLSAATGSGCVLPVPAIGPLQPSHRGAQLLLESMMPREAPAQSIQQGVGFPVRATGAQHLSTGRCQFRGLVVTLAALVAD